MQALMMKLQDKMKEIRSLQDYKLPRLNEQLANARGIFKSKERKALEEEIRQTEQQQTALEKSLPGLVKRAGYPNIQSFVTAYRKAEAIVEQYNRDLAEWERKKTQYQHPPEKESVRNRLRQLQAQGRQQKPRKKSFDRER